MSRWMDSFIINLHCQHVYCVKTIGLAFLLNSFVEISNPHFNVYLGQ